MPVRRRRRGPPDFHAAAVVVAAKLGTTPPGTDATRSAYMQRVYDTLNTRCFRGALPPCEVMSKNTVAWYEFAFATGRRPAKALANRWLNTIEITDVYADPARRRELQQILLHEICHWHANGHGDDFQAQLRKLASDARCAWVKPWVEKVEVPECKREERKYRRGKGPK